MIEFESRLARVIAGVSERMHGIKRTEGSLEELVEPYSELISRARTSVHIAFPMLPAEFFANPGLLHELQAMKESGGEVEVISKLVNQEKSSDVLKALSETGSTLYLDQGYIWFRPFTILDEKDIIVHNPDLGWTEIVQISVADAASISDYIRDFRQLRGNSLTLE